VVGGRASAGLLRVATLQESLVGRGRGVSCRGSPQRRIVRRREPPVSLPEPASGGWRAPVVSTGHGTPGGRPSLRAGAVPPVPAGVPGGLLLQGARAVPLVRGQAGGGARRISRRRGRGEGGHDASEPGEGERIDAEEFGARVLAQIPDPSRHVARDYGAYPNRAGGQRRRAESPLEGTSSGEAEEPVPPPAERAALRRRWANLIRRVYETDPHRRVVCPAGVGHPN
jgi:hypothetical protein